VEERARMADMSTVVGGQEEEFEQSNQRSAVEKGVKSKIDMCLNYM
jgi:hypothetical protein